MLVCPSVSVVFIIWSIRSSPFRGSVETQSPSLIRLSAICYLIPPRSRPKAAMQRLIQASQASCGWSSTSLASAFEELGMALLCHPPDTPHKCSWRPLLASYSK